MKKLFNGSIASLICVIAFLVACNKQKEINDNLAVNESNNANQDNIDDSNLHWYIYKSFQIENIVQLSEDSFQIKFKNKEGKLYLRYFDSLGIANKVSAVIHDYNDGKLYEVIVNKNENIQYNKTYINLENYINNAYSLNTRNLGEYLVIDNIIDFSNEPHKLLFSLIAIASEQKLNSYEDDNMLPDYERVLTINSCGSPNTVSMYNYAVGLANGNCPYGIFTHGGPGGSTWSYFTSGSGDFCISMTLVYDCL